MPSLITDKKNFFPNVLRTEEFKKKGFLYKQEAGGLIGLHWVVIDPRKHIMSVWEKVPGSDFEKQAKSLNATVVTNGNFFKYKAGSGSWALAKVTGAACWGMVKYSGAKFTSIFTGKDPVDVWASTVEQSIKDNFGASTPVGHIHGKGITETKVSAKNLDYFARHGGRQFSHYSIGNGDPAKMDAVIGGLLPTVRNYKVVTTDASSTQRGFWGLAPIKSQDAIWNDGNLRTELESSLAELNEYDAVHNPNMPKLDGVIITVFQMAKATTIANMLATALVKDAVQLDGSGSVLLCVSGKNVVGDKMPMHKRTGNTWGYRFTPG